MNFSLTPEQDAVQQRAREVSQEVKALAAWRLRLPLPPWGERVNA
ncbi:MAG: hypothetical protein ACYDIC_04225 [Desulfobaccales bacterium]